MTATTPLPQEIYARDGNGYTYICTATDEATGEPVSTLRSIDSGEYLSLPFSEFLAQFSRVSEFEECLLSLLGKV